MEKRGKRSGWEAVCEGFGVKTGYRQATAIGAGDSLILIPNQQGLQRAFRLERWNLSGGFQN
jgi:hypothetical protein